MDADVSAHSTQSVATITANGAPDQSHIRMRLYVLLSSSIKIVIGLPPAFWALPDVSPVGRDFSKTGTGDPADSDVFLD